MICQMRKTFAEEYDLVGGWLDQVVLTTPYSEGIQMFKECQPWLGTSDKHNLLFGRFAAIFADPAIRLAASCYFGETMKSMRSF